MNFLKNFIKCFKEVNVFNLYPGEHIKNWRPRYFILLDNGALIGFKVKPEHGFDDPLNNFTVKGKPFVILTNVVYFMVLEVQVFA